MTTPLIMLLLLMTPYLATRVIAIVKRSSAEGRTAAAIGLGLLFAFTGIGHFAQTEAMTLMLPESVPERSAIVLLTGVMEFGIAIGFFIPRTRMLSGWLAATLLILFFPANVYAAFNHVPLGGHAWGPIYLVIRAPLQAIILLWVYWFTIRIEGAPVYVPIEPVPDRAADGSQPRH